MHVLSPKGKTKDNGKSLPVPIPTTVATNPHGDYLSAVSSLAHEIRNPLTNIFLALELMGLKYEITDSEFIEYKEIIRHSSMQINDLILRELLPAKIPKENKTNHSLHQVLDEVLEMAGDRIRLKRIKVQKHYTQSAVEVNLDKKEIKIAFLNIIINAIEAMSAWKGELKLITSSANGKCILTIEDNGIGIRKENIAKLFDPSYTNKTNGVGFGLATTQQILKSNNAVVDVKSKEQKGTKFIISFNRIKAASH